MAMVAMQGADQHIFSKDTLTCRPGESNPQQDAGTTPEPQLPS